MKLTNKEALKQLKTVRSCELEERIESYPENERDGRSDLQMLADEAGYMYSLFFENGTAHYDDLEDAKEVLRETKNGKEIPLNARTLKPIYRQYYIDNCKERINEVKRLGNLMKRLNKMGIYSKW